MPKWEVADPASSDIVLRTSHLNIGAPTWIRTTSLRLRGAACRISCTLGAESWLPDLDSHQDTRLNRPPCYFDTIRQDSSGGIAARRSLGMRNAPSLGGDSAVGTGGPDGTCTRNRPADNGALWRLSYGSMNWWETLVTLQSSSSGRFGDGGSTARWPERFPKMGTPPWCCPRHIWLWKPDCAAGARRVRAADRVAYPAVIHPDDACEIPPPCCVSAERSVERSGETPRPARKNPGAGPFFSRSGHAPAQSGN